MSVIIKTGLDPKGANEDLGKLQGSLKGELGGALDSIQQKAKESEKSLSEMLKLQKAEAYIGKLGDLKDILEKAGTSVFGLDKKTVNAASSMADMAQKGASLLSVFGPIGAVGGAALGTVVGYLKSTSEAAAEAKAATEQISAALTQVEIDASNAVGEFDALGGTDLSGVIGQVKSLQEQLDKTKGFSRDVQENIDKLAKEGTKGLIQAFDRLAGAALGDEFRTQGKTLEDLNKLYDASSKNVEKLAKEAEATGQSIKAWSDIQVLTADQLAYAELTLKGYSDQIKEAKVESDAYKAAIDALKIGTTDSIPPIQAQTKAIDEQTIALKAAEEASRARVAAIDEETRAFLERRAVADEAAADRAEDGTGFDAAGMREMREEATAMTDASLEAVDAFSLMSEIPLPIVEVEHMATALDMVSERAKVLGEELKHALVEVGVGAAETLFANIEEGKKPIEGLGKAFAKLAAEQLKAIGSTLIGEGIANELKAAALLIVSLGANPQGYALAALGAVEIGVGLAMGGAGALLARRGNHGGTTPTSTGTSESLGSRESEASGPTQLAPVKIYLGPEQGMAVFSGDQRGVSEYGKFTTKAQEIAAKAPR